MAVDMFLILDGVKGESLDAKHAKATDVLAWSWGLSQSGSAHMGGGSGAGKANFQDISLTKYVDLGSPQLMYHCASGKHLAKAQLIVRKAGETPLEYMIFDFKDILVSSVSTGGSGGEDKLTENITLNFAEVKMQYWSQGAKGAKGDNTMWGWNIPQNAKV